MVYFLTGIYFILFTIKIKNNNLNIGMVYSNHKKQYEKFHVNYMKFKGSTTLSYISTK